ncbi:MAG: Gfo/Idh/MocA family oxidoreductase [Patescibacteria group bacterium]|nr:Gfo/Idh/MocA family oxidoreductase [Patescibacteria group bacterium]
MDKRKVNIGLIGYKFMGKAHSHAYLDMPKFFPDTSGVPVMQAVCGRNASDLITFARQWGWKNSCTDWRDLIERDDIDLVDITAPNNSHAEIAIAAAKAGKHVFCEKPLAMNVIEARDMLGAVKEAGVKHMINFNYRKAPAIALAKKMIDEGKLGKIYHFRSVYLQDWIINPDFPIVWRLDKTVAGSGSLGDLGAHIVDLARYLIGEFKFVVGMGETFIKERPLTEIGTTGGLAAKATGGKGEVTVDDATLFLARFVNGAVATFEVTRFATGRKNYNRFEINGSKGSIVFNLERMNELEYYNVDDPEGLQGFRVIQVTDPSHPYMQAWWPPAHIIGYEHTFIHQVYDLMQAIASDKQASPNFEDGLECQRVLEAVKCSIEDDKWVQIYYM